MATAVQQLAVAVTCSGKDASPLRGVSARAAASASEPRPCNNAKNEKG